MNKVVANIATYPARADIILGTVIRVAAQVDQVNLCLNDFEDIPASLAQIPNLNAVIPPRDLKDTGKFFFNCSDFDYVFYVDDDIIYPHDYVTGMIESYRRIGVQRSVVGLHAVLYPEFFNGNFKQRYVRTFTEGTPTDQVVNQLGTGTVMCPAALAPAFDYMVGSERFVDVRFARHCYENDIPMVSVRRSPQWLTEVVHSGETIFNSFTSSPSAKYVSEIQQINGISRLNLDVVRMVEGMNSGG